MSDIIESFARAVEERDVRIGIVGLGYVGLPLVLEFAKAGFNVRGFDADRKKLQQLVAGLRTHSES